MPNKTIYVSDADLLLVQRAQELAGGNLSAAITTALRRYVEIEEAREEGYEEITVVVGYGKARRKQRFSGTLLGEWGAMAGSRMDRYRLYRTRRGKFALHIDRSAEWSDSGSGNWIKDLANWRVMLGLEDHSWGFVQGESTLEVADTFEEFQGKIPTEFFDLVSAAVHQPPVEDLDI